MAPIPVFLDTDIGSDVDDVLALLTVLGSPELQLVGVGASYGDTLLRSRILAQVCGWVGVDVPIGAGPTEPLSGKSVWYAGHESSQLLPDGGAAGFQPADAVELLHDLASRHAGRLQVVAIAPLTTIATALRTDVRLVERLGGLNIMGGRFDDRRPEHNFACDSVAAAEVFDHPVPTRVIGVDVTARTRIAQHRFGEVAPGDGPLDRFLRAVLEQWVEFTGEPFSIPHDPLAVAMLTHPDGFATERGSVEVRSAGQLAGNATFRAGPGRVHRVTSVRSGIVDDLVERIGEPRLRDPGGPR